MGNLDAEGLEQMIRAYGNEITKLEGQVADLKRARHSLEINLFELQKQFVPVVMAPKRAERRERVTCRKCGTKTTGRVTTETGYEVGQCQHCKLSDAMAQAFWGPGETPAT